MSSQPMVIAHRGASGYHLDHTRVAYEAAIVQGADAIEPDLVFSQDGVLVIRHENEISATTDVASRPEFADRLTTKVVDGYELTGWFTEDFTWAELSTLTCRERVPELRPGNTAEDGLHPMLRLIDLLEIADQCENPLTLVLEIKHPTYFAGLGFSFEQALAQDLFLAGWDSRDPRVVVESFEKSVVMRCKEAGIGAEHWYIMDRENTAFDELVWARSEGVPSISNDEEFSEAGFEAFAGRLDGLAVATSMLWDGREETYAAAQELVARVKSHGLKVITWALRAENALLPEPFQSDGAPSEYGRAEEFFAKLWGFGVDAVFADQPDMAVRTRP